MINQDEIKALMRAVAASDRRTTGTADVHFWVAMARDAGWTFGTAMRALVQFRNQHPGEWLEPGHLTEIIRDARRRAAETFTAPDPPTGQPAHEYPAWLRARRDEHIRRVLDAWADGAEIPVTEQAVAELTGVSRPALEAGLDTSTCPPHLRDQVRRDFERIGRECERPRPRPAVALPRRMAGDPQRRAQARAELAGIEPTPMPDEPSTGQRDGDGD